MGKYIGRHPPTRDPETLLGLLRALRCLRKQHMTMGCCDLRWTLRHLQTPSQKAILGLPRLNMSLSNLSSCRKEACKRPHASREEPLEVESTQEELSLNQVYRNLTRLTSAGSF